MRKPILVGILIFSLGLNAASFGVLAWHWWFDEREDLLTTSGESDGWHRWFHEQRKVLKEPDETDLGKGDRKRIKELWAATDPGELGRIKRQAKDKLLEVLDLLDRSPLDEKALEKATAELVALKGRKETETIRRLRAVVSGLTEEKKRLFLGYLKSCIEKQQREKSSRAPARTAYEAM